MVKGKVIGFAIGFLLVYIILLWVLPNVLPRFFGSLSGVSSFSLMTSWGFYLVVAFSILLAISAFLPYNWGKILREISYLLLLIIVLITEMVIVSPFVRKIEVALSDCNNVFFPKETSGNVLYNVIDYTSCILAGYYPAESPETANVAWATFYIFYLILPFAFIWTLIYGLMSGMGMESWFGSFGKTANRLLSFIIAVFAARVLMGEILLEFLGYGAWGLAGLFGAIFLTRAVQHMIENWYKIEEMGQETRKAIEAELKVSKAYAEGAKLIIDEAKRIANTNLNAAKVELGKLKDISTYKLLGDTEKNMLNEMISLAAASPNNTQFLQIVERIEKYIKEVLAKRKT